MANYLSNAGGAWDNAKKYIGGRPPWRQGSEAHKAAVIRRHRRRPVKDTAGPALNPLIKVMNLCRLLILPAVISLSNISDSNFLKSTPKPAGYAIAVRRWWSCSVPSPSPSAPRHHRRRQPVQRQRREPGRHRRLRAAVAAEPLPSSHSVRPPGRALRPGDHGRTSGN